MPGFIGDTSNTASLVSYFSQLEAAITAVQQQVVSLQGGRGIGAFALTHTGPPAATDGSFVRGQFALDTNSVFYICTVAGTPGTWVSH